MHPVLQGPLKVSDDKSTLTVTPSGSGAKLTWSGSFKAKGAPDAKAEAVIGGLDEAGLKGIAEKAKERLRGRLLSRKQAPLVNCS